MKKMTRITAGLVALVLLLTVPVMAVDYVPSIEVKDAPGVEKVTDENDKEIELGEDGDLIVTPYKDADTLPPVEKELIETAYEELSDHEKVKEMVEKMGFDDPVVYTLFDAYATGTMIEQVEKGPINITLSLPGITPKDEVLMLVMNEKGEWESIPCIVGYDCITGTFSYLGVIAFVIERTGGSGKSPETGAKNYTAVAIAVLTVTACAAAAFIRKTCLSR